MAAALQRRPAEDGVIDLDDIAELSFPITQMLFSVVSASVKDWTRSLYGRRGLGTPTRGLGDTAHRLSQRLFLILCVDNHQIQKGHFSLFKMFNMNTLIMCTGCVQIFQGMDLTVDE